jgi:hypothetical protein
MAQGLWDELTTVFVNTEILLLAPSGTNDTASLVPISNRSRALHGMHL